MIDAIGLALIVTFAGLGALHIYWLLGGRVGINSAIPEIDGEAAFIPPRWATAAVALGLFSCAWLVGALLKFLPSPVGPTVLRPMAYLLATVFALRAIGDFNLIGFTKRQRGSRFARLDTLLYSPLCLVLAVAVIAVARIG
ncbi:MAG: DUF3995 domain-containing protein [Sphingorhabdus sp.]|uniref:DUF3995 domain-containing protein n=1 Tax=Sphingorhabdus sp. TaxID=1902408 RepID=UPI003CA86302